MQVHAHSPSTSHAHTGHRDSVSLVTTYIMPMWSRGRPDSVTSEQFVDWILQIKDLDIKKLKDLGEDLLIRLLHSKHDVDVWFFLKYCTCSVRHSINTRTIQHTFRDYRTTNKLVNILITKRFLRRIFWIFIFNMVSYKCEVTTQVNLLLATRTHILQDLQDLNDLDVVSDIVIYACRKKFINIGYEYIKVNMPLFINLPDIMYDNNTMPNYIDYADQIKSSPHTTIKKMALCSTLAYHHKDENFAEVTDLLLESAAKVSKYIITEYPIHIIAIEKYIRLKNFEWNTMLHLRADTLYIISDLCRIMRKDLLVMDMYFLNHIYSPPVIRKWKDAGIYEALAEILKTSVDQNHHISAKIYNQIAFQVLYGSLDTKDCSNRQSRSDIRVYLYKYADKIKSQSLLDAIRKKFPEVAYVYTDNHIAKRMPLHVDFKLLSQKVEKAIKIR